MSRHRPVASNAVLKHNSAVFQGRVHTCHAGQVQVGFQGSHPPTFALGEQIGLVLSGGELETAVRCDSQIRRRDEVSEGRRYTLRFDSTALRGAPAPPDTLERRAWSRVRPPDDQPVRITLSPIATSGRVRSKLQVDGILVDVGGGGLGVWVDGLEEGPLTGHAKVQVEFSPPGTDAFVRRACHIRSRALLDEEAIRVGLQFESIEDPRFVFEPSWDCTGCGTTGLLEHAHPFCCQCGRVRDVKTYLAAWDDLVPVVEHSFHGTDAHCEACGAQWNAAADHCGLCGTHLLA